MGAFNTFHLTIIKGSLDLVCHLPAEMAHVVLTSFSKMSLGVDLAAQVGNSENCMNGKKKMDIDYICRLSAIVQEKLSE